MPCAMRIRSALAGEVAAGGPLAAFQGYIGSRHGQARAKSGCCAWWNDGYGTALNRFGNFLANRLNLGGRRYDDIDLLEIPTLIDNGPYFIYATDCGPLAFIFIEHSIDRTIIVLTRMIESGAGAIAAPHFRLSRSGQRHQRYDPDE